MESVISLDTIDHIVKFLPFLFCLLLLNIFALVHIWRSKCASAGVKTIWTLMTLGVPVAGALCAFAFVRILPTHGESIPPAYMPNGGRLGTWRGGWK